ncbi:hypothetical protein [Hyalangium versicolor]|uniref:hypothetical protein n=1 Tax=Hyalangium versicolor TaxID=2861190 RepID=UPI001CCD3BB1|nr:hypothetical protein [Hyalangium versicolor]
MTSVAVSDVGTLLANIRDTYSDLPIHRVAPLVGPTRECDAILYGQTGFADETLFLYGYDAESLEHCFLYDTPWDELHRAYNGGKPAEWYDGLEMPRAFRVRYSIASPAQHEILDPLLKEMMDRPLRRLGTRPAIRNPFTAQAEEVLRDIDSWGERLRYLRRGSYVESASSPQVKDWTPATARFGGVVGSESARYVHYRFAVGDIEHVFAMKPAIRKMTPLDHAPWTSRKERRAHLAEARRYELTLGSFVSGQEVRVRFNPQAPVEHSLEFPPQREGETPPEVPVSTVTYQLEPVILPTR